MTQTPTTDARRLALVKAVGEWSHKNFGHNYSDHLLQNSSPYKRVGLGLTASVLGLSEELGELFEAETEAARADALADITIYLADLTYRASASGRLWDVEGRQPEQPDAIANLAAAVGRVSHVTLKRHQGIRGMDNDAGYAAAINDAIVRLWAALEYASSAVFNMSLMDLAEATFAGIVGNRDWLADPVTGGVSRTELA